MTVPKNVWWFEVLLYSSLFLNAISVAFADRTPSPDLSEQMIMAQVIYAVAMLSLVFYLIWFAANRRQGWPRWALSVLFALSLPSLVQTIVVRGIGLGDIIDIVSAALTTWGLYLSFTGDAKDWFDA